MNKTIFAALLALPILASQAHADPVSDRVYLTTMSVPACGTNSLGFRRIKQGPDGVSTIESGEFQVPDGTYLEVTSVIYTTPFFSPWATTYAQEIGVAIRQRVGTANTVVLNAYYQNQSLYGESSGSYGEIGEVAGPGAQTHVASFPVGPLMSSAGRLCVAASNNFWTYGGTVTLRGRLIPTGSIVATTTTTATNAP